MKIELFELVVEVTRKCNMNCEHCLRGDAQNMDIDHSYIDKLLKDVEYIGAITFSGGEPSLNISAIDYILKKCKENNIGVGGFYIVTNAKSNAEKLAISALKWYAFCDGYDKEYICGLAVSKDMFHSHVQETNIEIFKGLSFFRDKDKTTDFSNVALINSGRATKLSDRMFEKRTVDEHAETLDVEIYNNRVTVSSMIYLSANGEIRNNCNTAFDDYRFTIGDLNDSSFLDIVTGEMTNEKTRV